ncbi:MAG: flavin reductase [Prevotellaceae bacterium]|jgi:flavin reductase (DIM6/NTAB) family NADH-FMN oxidoreductase RutF|nr:flavin reductase [Prevotellaceae bacterium]
MRKQWVCGFAVLLLLACNNPSGKSKSGAATEAQATEVKTEDSRTFDELFTAITPEEITDNIFQLVGKDFSVITAGTSGGFNSMTASWGGVGILFNRPVAWCFLRANRYTLELIEKEQRYTLSYFPEEHKEQVLFFGSKSGRNTDKMKETTLTPMQTPSGNGTYREARLILECRLSGVTSVSPDDFYSQDAKDFINEGYADAKAYHKLVFGDIIHVWIRK